MEPLLVLLEEISGCLIEAQKRSELVLEVLPLWALGHRPAIGLLLCIEIVYLCREEEVLQDGVRMEGRKKDTRQTNIEKL